MSLTKEELKSKILEELKEFLMSVLDSTDNWNHSDLRELGWLDDYIPGLIEKIEDESF